jgi:RHS repeat-associated protein
MKKYLSFILIVSAVHFSLAQCPTLYTLSGEGAICMESPFTLTLSGSQIGVSYQALRNGANYGSPKAGTGNPLIWTNSAAPEALYTVIAVECGTLMTGSVDLNYINTAPPFALSGGGALCPGLTGVSISYSGSYVGDTYQLKVNGANVGAPKQGTGSALVWDNLSTPGSYTIFITDGSTGCTLTRGPINIYTLSSTPTQYEVSGGGEVCSGVTKSISLNGSQTGVYYQLQRNGINAGGPKQGTGNAISWSGISTIGTYTVVVPGCEIMMNGSVVVTNNPIQYTVGGGGSICPGSSTNITLSNSQPGVIYQLRLNGSNFGPPETGTGSSLAWNNISNVGTYTVVTTVCAKQMTGSVTVAVDPLPLVQTVSGGGQVCPGLLGASVNLNGSQTGVNYQLKLSGSAIGASKSGTGSALSWTDITQPGTYTVIALSAANCSVEMNGNAAVSLQEPPSASITGPVILQADPIVLSANTGAGFTYQWQLDGDDLMGMNSSTLIVSKSGNYQVTVIASGCPNTSSGHFVGVKVEPNFNGLISSIRWRTDKAHEVTGSEYKGMYIYHYDQKYQIKEATWAIPDFTLNTFSYAANTFRVSDLGYDPNGNILSLRRYNESGARQHNFVYQYNADPAKPQQTNQLQHIPGYASYQYNNLGQLTAEDKAMGDDQYIEYDVSGKVRKVFSDDARQTLKVEFIYDDRGFRLAKINYLTNRKTWYIRDASGNVLSIYEEDLSNGALNQTEIPIYGSGKLGTFYPQQDASVNYEITDHLGNVRALVRDNITVYTATMEDNDQEQITNPRVEELQYFENLFETEQEDAFMNVSPSIPGVVDKPNKVAYLHWNDNPGTQQSDMETWTRYEEKSSFIRDFNLAALSALLGSTFVGSVGFETFSLPQTTGNLQSALLAALYPNDEDGSGRPYAYLNYIVYDENMVPVPGGTNWLRVPEEAGSPAEGLYIPENKPIKLAFDEPVLIVENGYIYVWVSNQSKNTRVWFDDLTVKHEGVILTQATDYGVWGDVIREQKTDESVYRYGYQGQFAEKDGETGWSHFELREYDPVIGRWTAVDPENQFYSPYVGMGNNPINGIDKDGSFFLDKFLIDNEGNVILQEVTNDKYHSFYNEDGRLLFTTSIALNEEYNLWGENHTRTYFNELIGAIQTIQTKVRTDNDLFKYMMNRAEAEGWDPDILGEMRIAADYNQGGRGMKIALDLLPINKNAIGRDVPDNPTEKVTHIYEFATRGRDPWTDFKIGLRKTIKGIGDMSNNVVYQFNQNVKSINNGWRR